MDQEWFEMRAERERRLDAAAWIPLRSTQTLLSSGTLGQAGFREELYHAGSLAVATSNKAQAETLRWPDVGTARSHSSYVEEGQYVPADVFVMGTEALPAVPLVLEQRGNRENPNQWHLHQDLVIALGLIREGDRWLGIDEGYIEVARLHRREDGRPDLLEIRAEQLKDYLCARNMALYVTSYRSRTEIVVDARHIHWDENPISQLKGLDRWEGRMSDIHEGGMPFGAAAKVFHIARTDVDQAEDVPVLGLPSDGKVLATSWVVQPEGKKLTRIEGELWRSEWVEPLAFSPRVRHDKPPPTVFFLTDTKGSRESAASLAGGRRWLWFRPEVMMALAHRRGGALAWYTRDTGGVRCSPDYDVCFGVNKLGLINVYAKDIALLPEWQQRLWAGFSVSPEGGVSEELLASQVKAEPADTQAPEGFLRNGLEKLNRAGIARFGFPLLRTHRDFEALIAQTHRFRSVNVPGFLSLAKDVARLTADSIDLSALQKVVSLPKDFKGRSLKTLESVVAQTVGPVTAHELLGPLFGAYELRIADAHLASSDLEAALRLVGVDNRLPYVQQGLLLLSACVASLYEIADALQPS